MVRPVGKTRRAGRTRQVGTIWPAGRKGNVSR
jgi:hypothetical protein